MNVTLPLVLLAIGGELGAGDRQTLARFSARWSVEFVTTRARLLEEPPEGVLPPYASLAPIVAHVEALLDTARLGVARMDEVESREALKAAERLLTQHPELPQAAWLRAEQLTLDAELVHATGGAGGDELRRRARALEGPRSSAFQAPAPAAPAPSTDGVHTVTLSGLGPRDQLEWDGVRSSVPVNAPAGEHHARVLRRGFPIHAAWISVVGDSTAVALAVPVSEPCSSEDLAGTRTEPDGPRPEPGVACPRWAAARRERGELEVALCRHSECGRWYRLGPAPPAERTPSSAPAVSRGLPTWATIALAGAGAALATSIVLWQTGAFEPEPPGRERWVYRGLELR